MRKNYKVLFFCIIITISVSIITWNVRSSAPGIYQESTSSKRTISSSLYIAVVTSGSLINSRGNTINSTWGQMTSDIEYYVGEGQENNSKLPAIGLKGTDDGYPPQKKVYAMYQYLYDNYIDKYDWFMRADDDVYVKVPKLKKYLSNLDPSQPLYIGSPGKGRKQDLKRLKLLPTDTYCMGGPGVVLSRALLQKLGPHLKECLDNVVVSYNEDVEVGRCIIRRLDIQCTNSKHVSNIQCIMSLIVPE